MVFFKTDYGNLEASLDHHDGLTVLAFLFEATDEENKYYTLFQDGLYRIQDVNATLNMTNFVSLDKFTSKKRDSYLTYEGSLTTPPCSEVVTWIEFQNTIPLAHSQVAIINKTKYRNWVLYNRDFNCRFNNFATCPTVME